MKPLKTSYECNLNSDPILSCVHFTADDTGLHRSGNYGDAELYVTRTTDEDGHVTLSFTDKRQRLVLTRQLNGSDRVDTYYVYDDFDKPLYVLPPLASDALVNDGDYTYSNTAVANYAYCYKYDGLQRCIEKKLPGCDPVYFVYDKAGRPVLTQNGVQRNNNEWIFTKFDAFGQVVLTGTCQLSETADALRTRFKSVAFTEKYDKTGEYGYTNNANLNATSKKILTVNYYDNYDYLTQLIPNSSELDYTDTDTVYNKKYENATYSTISAKGMLTGTRVFMLEESGKEIVTALYYDTDGRLIQSKATNHLGGYEKNYFALSFSGKTLKHKHDHSAYGKANIKEVYTYTYDDADRLLKTSHSLNSAIGTVLSENIYNELGRLSSKKQCSGRQTINYGYNVRNWLTFIRNSNYFYQYIEYTGSSNNNTPCFNGNISNVVSSIPYRARSRGYNFTYDGLNRISAANYLDNDTLSTQYSTSYTYDKQGNITGLTRNGLADGSTFATIDNLAMTYNGNQLTKVDDAATDPSYSGSFNFVDGNKTSGTEYVYDNNGNLTQDKNKGIALIKYNSLNLPSSLQFAYGHTTDYLYDGSGIKRRVKQVTTTENLLVPMGSTQPVPADKVSVTTQTDYCGDVIYENGKPKRILTDEGFYDFEDSRYYFYMKDYQGNNRVLYANGSYEHNNFYPFGMSFGDNYSNVDEVVNPYKYNGKELDRMHGLDLYDYGARNYDPALGRWLTMDPLAEKYFSISPYAYCANNPIRFIDLKGRDLFDVNGHFIKNDGSNIIRVQTANGNVPISSLAMNNMSNRQIVANVTGYYGNKIGIHSPGDIGVSNYKENSSKVPAFITGKNIYLNATGGINKLLDNKYNMLSTLFHEGEHMTLGHGEKETSNMTHAKVYLNQMKDESFKNTTSDFKRQTTGGFVAILSDAIMNDGAQDSQIQELIGQFNKLNTNYEVLFERKGSDSYKLEIVNKR